MTSIECRVTRGKNNAILVVDAPNGNVSNLYKAIRTEHPELTHQEALDHYSKFYTEGFKRRFGDFELGNSDLKLDENNEPVYAQEALNKLKVSNKLESGFFKDFNITIGELDAIKKRIKVDKGSVTDFLEKVIFTDDEVEFTKEAAFFAFMFLGKHNNKLKADLRYNIRLWGEIQEGETIGDIYKSKFEEYSQKFYEVHGFYPDSKAWRDRINDDIIIDYIAEDFVAYYNNQIQAARVDDTQYTEKETEEFIKIGKARAGKLGILEQLYQFIKDWWKKNFGNLNIQERKARLATISQSIVSEILDQDYRIFNYPLAEGQVKTYFQETIGKDLLAQDVLRIADKYNLYTSGSLALRRQGDTYRTPDELLHDIDLTVSFEALLSEKKKLDKLQALAATIQKEGRDSNRLKWMIEDKAQKIIHSYAFVNEFEQKFDTITPLNTWYDFNQNFFVSQFVINGEFFKEKGTHIISDSRGNEKVVKHKKGDLIPGTGYHIDLFLYHDPNSNRIGIDNFEHWKSIYFAKMITMGGRYKDLVDHKYYIPYVRNFDGEFMHPSYTYTNTPSVLDGNNAAVQERQNTLEPDSKIEPIVSNLTEVDPELYEIQDHSYPDVNVIIEEGNRRITVSAVRKLSESLGVPYRSIGAKEAEQLTADSKNPWSGQPAFYYKGEVYFVSNNINETIAFHEFSHPFVSYLRTVNLPLYNTLLEGILETEEGQRIAQEAELEYRDIKDPGVNDAVKDEIIVMALTEKFDAINNGVKTTKKFDNIISKILYHIKQFLRKIFGRKIKIENLSVNTTLEDLVNMLNAGEKFDINLDLIKESNIVSYLNDVKELADELQKVAEKSEKAQFRLIEQNYEALRSALSVVNEPGFSTEIKTMLDNEAGRGYIADQLGNIRKFTKKAELDPDTKKVIDSMDSIDYMFNKSRAMATNLVKMNQMLTKVNDYVDSLENHPDPQYATAQMFHYQRFNTPIKEWATEADSILLNEGVSPENPVRQQLASIKRKAEDVDVKTKAIFLEGATNLVELVNPVNEVIEFYYKANKEKLEKLIKNSSGAVKESYEKRLKQEKERYEDSLLDKSKIAAYFAGAVNQDNSWYHSWITNYISNPDPLIGTLGKFLKDNWVQVQAENNRMYYEFVNDLNSLMNEAGYKFNATRLDKIADQLLFLDEDGYYDEETGEIKKDLKYVFMGEFKNYRLSLLQYRHATTKAKQQWEKTRSTEDEAAYAEAVSNEERHRSLFFQRKYADVIYELSDKIRAVKMDLALDPEKPNEITKDVNVGEIALLRSEEVLNQIKDLDVRTELSDGHMVRQESDQRDALWREFKQLFNIKDNYNKPKDVLSQAVAEVLTNFRKEKSKYYEWIQIPGAFETALNDYEVLIKERLKERVIAKEFEEGSPEYIQEFNRQRKDYIDANIRHKNKDSFYADRERLHMELKSMLDALEVKRKAAAAKAGIAYTPMPRLDVLYKKLNDALSGRRDDDGQPVAIEMTDELLKYIKDLQEEIKEAKKSFISISGLTESENTTFSFLINKIINKQRLNAQEQETYDRLNTKKSTLGMDRITRKRFFAKLEELENMQNKIPTVYYMEIINEYYQDLIKPDGKLREENGSLAIYSANNQILDPSFIDPYLEKDSEFKEWFLSNHILLNKWNGEEKVPTYERLKAWTVIKPADKAYYETTRLSTGEVIEGVPKLKFWYRKVKNEYMTGYNPKTGKVELVTGVHRDAQNRWLPKPLSEMEKIYRSNPEKFSPENPYDKYINREYLKEKDKNSAIYRIAELIKQRKNDWEKDVAPHLKLGSDLARLPKRRNGYYEYLLGFVNDNPFKAAASAWSSFRDNWRKRKDDQEFGLNYEEELQYENIQGMFAPDQRSVPIRGTYRMDYKNVSLDIFQSELQRMFSANMHNRLSQTQPIASAFKTLINEFDTDALKRVHQRLYPDMPLAVSGKDNKKERQRAINALYDTWWQGQNVAQKNLLGQERNSTALKAVNSLLGLASHSFFSLDIPSALKNSFGAQFQLGTEAVINQSYYNPHTKKMEVLVTYPNWQWGTLKAGEAGALLQKDIYEKGTKSLLTQIIENFDLIQGRTEEKFGTSYSRSFAKDVVDLKWGGSFRKYTENHVTLQMGLGALKTIKVEQTLGGTTRKISYIDAFELDQDGILKLKDGIDKTYAPGGKMFNLYVNRIHQVNVYNQGNYAKLDQPLANRYMLYRMFISMKKFFFPMFLHRYHYSKRGGGNIFNPLTWSRMEEQWNPALNDYHMGHYAQTLRFIGRVAESRGDYLTNATPQEVKAMIRSVIEPIKAILFYYAVIGIFGLWDFDWEDDEKWKKRRKASGALALPFGLTDKEWTKGFDLEGFIDNHALLFAMNVTQENTFFLPTWSNLKSQYEMMTNFSIASKGSAELILGMVDLWLKGDEYAKSTGAMSYQQAGAAKYWKMLAKLAGEPFKGKTADPVTNAKNIDSYIRPAEWIRVLD